MHPTLFQSARELACYACGTPLGRVTLLLPYLGFDAERAELDGGAFLLECPKCERVTTAAAIMRENRP